MKLPSPHPYQSYLPAPTVRHWYYQFSPPFGNKAEGQSLHTHTHEQIIQLMQNDWNEYNEENPIDWDVVVR